MSNYIRDDASELMKFFKNYNLKEISDDDDFNNDFKTVHKKIFGYLVLFCEIEYQNKKEKLFSDQALFYLKESVSDILQSLFAWVNGAYKSADLLLRSSIENFNKSIIGNTHVEVFTEKSVYKIFDMAAELSEYQKKVLKNSFLEILHRLYGELCKSTHTATCADMEHITALSLLPKFDKEQSNEYKRSIMTLVDCYLGFFLANRKKEIIDKMYRTHIDTFYDVLPQNLIRDIVNKI